MNYTNSRLLTCRYWAFGHCPDVNGQGTGTCPFAHYDTGQLASHLVQRGTCQWWLERRCPNGCNCFYEHRYTGLQGLYQGVLKLNGLDLEIANAAFSSGFNTSNHAALFDLIWSIKRISRRSSRSGRRPPPAHPIYPDRYRPSGIGDNPKRKRKLPRDNNSPSLYPVVSPLRRSNKKHKRDGKSYKDSSHFNAIGGTQTNPICLDLEDEALPTVALAKRRRLNDDQLRLRKDTIDPVAWMSNHMVESTTRTSDEKTKARFLASTNLRQNNNIKREVTAENPLVERQFSCRENTAVIVDLEVVKDKLRQSETVMTNQQRILEECRLTMQAHFDLNASIYDSDHAMTILTALANHINGAASELSEGSAELRNIMEWINSDKMLQGEML